MRAAGIEQFASRVRTIDVADPREPHRREVLIEVKAAGVGNWDDIVRMGDGMLDYGRRWRSASKELAS